MILNTSTLILVYVRIEGIYCNKLKKNKQYHPVMYDQPYILSHQIVSVNKKNAKLRKMNKKGEKKQKQKQTNYTSEQFQNSFEKSPNHFPGLVHAY
jgi:thioredoxin-related protein